MELIQEVFSNFITGFAKLFLISLIIWMIGLLVLLFREMFSSGEFVFREYLYKVWKMFRLAFEIVAYAGVIIVPIVMFITKDYFVNTMLTIDSVILSIIYLYIRKQMGGFKEKKRMRKEKDHQEWQ